YTSATNLKNLVLSSSTISLTPGEIIGSSGLAIRNIPGTPTKINEKTLRLINPIGTQEVLQLVPGVQVAADDGMGNSRISIGIRGLNPRRSSRVLILEDGIPIQPAIYLYPNSYYNPPVERIDRIEVIKGSSSIKFGPQTMGGVVNYITNAPTDKFGGRAEIIGGTNNLLSAFTQISGFGNEKFSPQVQLLYKTADGYREHNHFEQYNATVKFNILPGPDKRLYIKMNANHEVSDATYTGLTEYSYHTDPTFNPKKYDQFLVDRYSLDIILNDNINSHLSANTLVYANYFNRDWWRENDIYVDAQKYLETGDLTPVPYYYKNYQADIVRVGNGKDNFGNLRTFYVGGVERSYRYNHSFFGLPANLEAGGRVHWERFIDRQKVGTAPDARDGMYYYTDTSGNEIVVGKNEAYETTAFSVYGSQKLNLTENFEATFGLRAEAFEQEKINRLNGNVYQDKTSYVLLPGIGFNYSSGKNNYFLGLHRGYTPPSNATLNVLGFGASASGLDLKAEKSWNSEIGIRRTSSAFSYEAALFYMYIKDFVAPAKGVIMKNLGAARSGGLELTALVSPAKFRKVNLQWLPELSLTYTYMNTAILDGRISASQFAGEVDIAGKEMPYVPDHAFTVALTKAFNFGLTIRADYQYTGRVFTDYENLNFIGNGGYTGPIAAYSLINASARYDINKHFSVTLNGKNLLDKIYIGSRLHSAPNQPDANISSGIMPGPRRQINLGIRYHF
ncbi:MAG: TonB-dependent receptor family protein, partial [Bacteroidia bacterium]